MFLPLPSTNIGSHSPHPNRHLSSSTTSHRLQSRTPNSPSRSSSCHCPMHDRCYVHSALQALHSISVVVRAAADAVTMPIREFAAAAAVVCASAGECVAMMAPAAIVCSTPSHARYPHRDVEVVHVSLEGATARPRSLRIDSWQTPQLPRRYHALSVFCALLAQLLQQQLLLPFLNSHQFSRHRRVHVSYSYIPY